MRKIKKLIVVVFVACLVPFNSGCNSNNNQKEINSNTISGKILFKEPMSDGKAISGSDFVTLDPFYCTITPVGFQGSQAKFFGSTSKILIQHDLGNIELFDAATKEKRIVYNTDAGLESSYYSTAFVDNSHFSIADFKKICLVDIQSGKSVVVVNGACGIHSWCENGKVLYYSTDKKIYSYNIQTEEKTYITDGINPNISSDGETLAYQKNNTLYVENLKSGKKWKYKYDPLYFCLSPDSKYVAVVEYWSGTWFYDGYTVKIWDYKKNNSQTILPRYANGQCSGIDWAE